MSHLHLQNFAGAVSGHACVDPAFESAATRSKPVMANVES